MSRIDSTHRLLKPRVFQSSHGVMDLVRSQMRVSLRHFDRRVTEKVAHDQQWYAGHHQPRRACVAKIVDPEVFDICLGADGAKALLNGAQRLGVVSGRGKDPGRCGAVFRAPCGHGVQRLKRRCVKRDDAVLFCFRVFAFERYKTLFSAHALQTQPEQFIPAAAGVQSQLDKRGKVRPHRHRLSYRDQALRFGPCDPSCSAFGHRQCHADKGIWQVELVQEVVPIDRRAHVVQLAVDRSRADASCFPKGDVPIDGGTSQTAYRTPLEEAVELQLAVPKSLRIFAGRLVHLHHSIVGRILVDHAFVVDVLRWVLHAIDRRTRWGQLAGNVVG